MDWEFKILDAIQKYFSGNFMDNIMSKISSLGNAGLIWIILTIILLLFKRTRKYGYTCGLSLIIMLLPVIYLLKILYVGLDHSKLESILILL